MKNVKQSMILMSLNPYCSGQWSRTFQNHSRLALLKVLILVVVDDGLVPNKFSLLEDH